MHANRFDLKLAAAVYSNQELMIGFQPGLHEESAGRHEGLDTKNLEKQELYDMLAMIYFLPAYASKGMNREYLLAVHQDRVFRVPLMVYKHFEVDLAPEMMKRTGVVNNAILVRKLNKLLGNTNRKLLGFEEYDPPEQVV